MDRVDETDESHVSIAIVDAVGWLEFDSPPVNAFGWAAVRQIRDAIDPLESDPEVRVIVVASALERYFSAGADLETFRDFDAAAMAEWCDLVHDIVHKLRGATKPVLAAIHGVAVGGGLEIALHCDRRFAAADARLGQPEVNINFIPPVGATQALVRLIGRPAALAYLYGGTLITAAQALEIGLVDEVIERESLRSAVQTYAASLCAKPPEALAAIRRTVNLGGGLPFDQGLEVEREAAIALAGTANFGEGVRAFLEKRDPRWHR